MKMKKLLLLLCTTVLLSCNNDTPKATPSKVEHTTLLVATEGKLINFDLDQKKIAWQFQNPMDSTGNRNLFALDGQNIFMPFESGKLINFDVNTGKIIWQQQIYGNGDEPLGMGNGEEDEKIMIRSQMPLFMAKPLVDEQNILMASTAQPMEGGRAWLYNFNRTNGKKKWLSDLPTVFNLFAPVKYRNYYFINSAVFLEKFDAKTGVNTSYGMFDGDLEIAGQPLQHHEVNQFDVPIYNQMQSDGQRIFIGSEKGTIYALELNKDGNLADGDIADPNNTFIKNPKAFKWTFSDKAFHFPGNNKLILEDGTLYTEMKGDTNTCFFAINADNGKLKWKKILPSNIQNWTLNGDKIVGYTNKSIFYLDTDGENFTETNIKNLPLSDMESMDDTHFVYVTQKGVEIFDTKTKTTKLVITQAFNKNEHNNVQIKYISR